MESAERLALVAERELEALVGVSTPSGDVAGAEEAVALCVAFLPPEAQPERLECSTPGHAPDLLGRLAGTGERRLLLVGHLDTVVAHDAHRPLTRDGDRLLGSGTVDMKGGVALALGVMRELAAQPELYAEAAVLLVNDEEWRTVPFAHTERFRGWDACVCFEAGEIDAQGQDAVIVRRKAAGTLEISAQGRPAHSGSAPHKGRSALLALAGIAQRVASSSDPSGPDRLTAVPTILSSGDAFNVVPPLGRLVCDLRADDLAAFQPVLGAVPEEVDGVSIESALVRAWPGMDTRSATAGLLEAAAERLGRPLVASERGGASDASHIAQGVPVTVDGLGPRGGGAHTPHEWVSAKSLRTRAEVALALVAAVLRG
ncbi:MAG: glutamate carboxypeptidase [Thermoleophilaceae bacterium]|jgi:glutamate carboxypeptidase|nr:glutamate carboxypeptidase [Thermoleophilaceae bacterium]